MYESCFAFITQMDIKPGEYKVSSAKLYQEYHRFCYKNKLSIYEPNCLGYILVQYYIKKSNFRKRIGATRFNQRKFNFYYINKPEWELPIEEVIKIQQKYYISLRKRRSVYDKENKTRISELKNAEKEFKEED